MIAPIECVTNLPDASTTAFDSLIVINDDVKLNDEGLAPISSALEQNASINKGLLGGNAVIMFCDAAPQKRLIFASTGKLNRDFDDLRNIFNAAEQATKCAVSAGSVKPLFVLGDCASAPKDDARFKSVEHLQRALILGVHYAAYNPLQVREFFSDKASTKLTKVGLYKVNKDLISQVDAVESGRIVARDIGASDPERMAPPSCAQYIEKAFPSATSVIKVTVTPIDEQQYPLMAAVDRGCNKIDRHQGRVVMLEYRGQGEIEESLYLVGKGITMDTGGVDVKIGGAMVGMHRDKCGAAAVAGFFKVLDDIKPPHLYCKAYLAFVRNSIGSEAYTCDEVIVSRAKRRVRIVNTDAEGRMAMGDLLCLAKEEALANTQYPKPQLFTVATLTGHAVLAYGKFTAALGNGLSRKYNIPHALQSAGDLMAEIIEVSTLRREDMDYHRNPDEYADVRQSGPKPSSQTARGHQTPMGFLTLVSGLDEHGLDSKQPLAYTHLDCAAGAGLFPEVPITTGSPLAALAMKYIFKA